MQALAFWKVVTMDQENLLERLSALLEEHSIRYYASYPVIVERDRVRVAIPA